MNKKSLHVACLVVAALIICPILAIGGESGPVQLLKPQMEIGKPLMQVLRDRTSSRAFSPDKLPNQVLSNLLWAAFGVNRPESGKRTAPSAVNAQEIDIYVATADGLFLYDAKAHTLKPVLSEDIRALTGKQSYVKEAPVNLVYVADLSGSKIADENERAFYAAADTGFISENVYLYCASEGLATVVRGSIDRPALAKAMKLRPDQRIILSQTVGYPKK
jgi:SagB-type dehydrogenase family enzyme